MLGLETFCLLWFLDGRLSVFDGSLGAGIGN
jgi:hypothetical protein